jgi:uncharacterized membrane protein YhaH (DUF805 family)
LSESSRGRAVSVSAWWLVLLVVFLVIEIAFLVGAYTSGMAGLERIFGVFTGLILVTFGIMLYAGRLIFYD